MAQTVLIIICNAQKDRRP